MTRTAQQQDITLVDMHMRTAESGFGVCQKSNNENLARACEVILKLLLRWPVAPPLLPCITCPLKRQHHLQQLQQSLALLLLQSWRCQNAEGVRGGSLPRICLAAMAAPICCGKHPAEPGQQSQNLGIVIQLPSVRNTTTAWQQPAPDHQQSHCYSCHHSITVVVAAAAACAVVPMLLTCNNPTNHRSLHLHLPTPSRPCFWQPAPEPPPQPPQRSTCRMPL